MADGLHARTGGFTSLAVALGAIGVLKGAATEVFRRLLDGVDPALVDQAEKALISTPGVMGVDSIQLRWIGHQLHAETSIAPL